MIDQEALDEAMIQIPSLVTRFPIDDTELEIHRIEASYAEQALILSGRLQALAE